MRTARSTPTATAVQIAAAVGCHPSTVRKHLAPTPARAAAAADDIRRRGALDATASQLWRMLADGDRDVRWWAAANPRCPPATARLSNDSDPGVRSTAVSNPNCPPALLRRAARHLHADVRAAAAGNPSLPPTLRSRLIADRDPAVQAAAVGRHRRRDGLSGRPVVFTGSFTHFNRATVAAAAEAAGAFVYTKVGYGTAYLVAGRGNPASVVGPTGLSSKRRAANEGRVPVMDEAEFIAMLPPAVRDVHLPRQPL